MNVDKPTKKCTAHVEGCRYELAKKETLLKGIGYLKRDGGWMPFPSLGEARHQFELEYASKGYDLSVECSCLKG